MNAGYNSHRPHNSFGDQSPQRLALQLPPSATDRKLDSQGAGREGFITLAPAPTGLAVRSEQSVQLLEQVLEPVERRRAIRVGLGKP